MEYEVVGLDTDWFLYFSRFPEELVEFSRFQFGKDIVEDHTEWVPKYNTIPFTYSEPAPHDFHDYFCLLHKGQVDLLKRFGLENVDFMNEKYPLELLEYVFPDKEPSFYERYVI